MTQRGGSRKRHAHPGYGNHRDLKRWGMVVPSPVCNVTEPRPDRPEGGSAATESTASLITTPKRLVAEPSAYVIGILGSSRREAGLGLARRSGRNFQLFWILLKTYFCKLAPGIWPSPNPQQRRKILWSLTVNNHPKKGNFHSPWRGDLKTFEGRVAEVAKMAITLERNEIISPKSAHLCMGSVCGQAKKGRCDWPLGGTVRRKKNEY